MQKEQQHKTVNWHTTNPFNEKCFMSWSNMKSLNDHVGVAVLQSCTASPALSRLFTQDLLSAKS